MTVLVPMTVEQDEDGWWCAHAQLGPNVGANGQGQTRKEALDDLREAILASFEADGGIPEWLVRSDLLGSAEATMSCGIRTVAVPLSLRTGIRSCESAHCAGSCVTAG
jgi:predicted RNase H-like HicB family nuclease